MKTKIFNGSRCFLYIFNGSLFLYILAILYMKNELAQFYGHVWLFQVLAVLLIVLSIKRIEMFLRHLTDAFLFQGRNDYKKILVQASKGMVLITDIQKILNLIVYIVKKHLRLKNACIFLYDSKSGYYVLRSLRGLKRSFLGYKLESGHYLIKWLTDNRRIFLCNTDIGKLNDKEKQELIKLRCSVCVPSFWKQKLLGFLILGDKFSGDGYTVKEMDLLSTLSNEVAIALENAKNFEELKRLKMIERENYFETVLALARTVDEKDSYTRGHLDEVTKYGMEVVDELMSLKSININKEELKFALLLHDIGKIGVPDALLNKNGRLEPEEWDVMKQHAEIGARIVEPMSKLKNVRAMIKHHQEKYDGTGYPDGLKGENIPIESRIIAVVDAYHAMISDRPYRKALPEGVAINELKNNRGTQFDPIVVDAFLKAWEKGNIKK